VCVGVVWCVCVCGVCVCVCVCHAGKKQKLRAIYGSQNMEGEIQF